LQHTYEGLISKKIESLCKPEFAPTNHLLINYIRHIYAKYALEDPMRKYGDQKFWGSAETRAYSTQKTTPTKEFNSQQRSLIPHSHSFVNPEQPIFHSRYITPEKSFAESRVTGNETLVGNMQGGTDSYQIRNSSGTSAMGSQVVRNS
jgi:hypothetical protein